MPLSSIICIVCDGIFDPFRLVNMIHLTDLSVDNIWKIVKKITLQTIDEYCGETFNAWDTRLMLLEQNLKIRNDKIFDNVTVEDLHIAGEIFIYFNTCPKSWRKWLRFYDDLFQFIACKIIISKISSIQKELKCLRIYV